MKHIGYFIIMKRVFGNGKNIMKILRLNLDSLAEEGYFYTEYDIGEEGHAITINAEDKEKFLDAYAAEWRKRAEASLEEPIED